MLILKRPTKAPFLTTIFFLILLTIRRRDQMTDAKGIKGSSSAPKTQIAMWSVIKSKWKVLYWAGSRIQKQPESSHIQHTNACTVTKYFSRTDFYPVSFVPPGKGKSYVQVFYSLMRHIFMTALGYKIDWDLIKSWSLIWNIYKVIYD